MILRQRYLYDIDGPAIFLILTYSFVQLTVMARDFSETLWRLQNVELSAYVRLKLFSLCVFLKFLSMICEYFGLNQATQFTIWKSLILRIRLQKVRGR